jgi:hypothetical protein
MITAREPKADSAAPLSKILKPGDRPTFRGLNVPVGRGFSFFIRFLHQTTGTLLGLLGHPVVHVSHVLFTPLCLQLVPNKLIQSIQMVKPNRECSTSTERIRR